MENENNQKEKVESLVKAIRTLHLSHTQENHPLSNQIDRTPCMPHLLKQ
jgi:hypothetical protein